MRHIHQIYIYSILLSIANVYGAPTSKLHCVTENYPPFNYVDEQGKLAGTSTAIVKKVLQHAGFTCDMQVLPWARALWFAKEKENYLIFTIARTPSREKHFQWIRPLVKPLGVYFYKRKGNEKITLNNKLQETKKYNIGVMNKSSFHEFLQINQFKNITPAPHYGQTFRLLASDRIDLLFIAKDSFDSFFDKGEEKEELAKAGITKEKFERLFSPWSIVEYMAFGNKTPKATIKKLQKSYDTLLNEGSIKLPD